MPQNLRICVFGLGYVGLSNAVLMARNNAVVATDISQPRVDLVNAKKSPISDPEIEKILKSDNLNLRATSDPKEACLNADIVLIATPTNYDPNTNKFDTTSVESVVDLVSVTNPSCTIVIRSTIPVGFVRDLRSRYRGQKIIFSPEFLREGNTIKDNLYPSRIIVGSKCNAGRQFADLLMEISRDKSTPIVLTDSDEAEAIKLFANTYLAMRVAFFNELDSYAVLHKLNTKDIIEGVCLDSRIGMQYNNPSFGYGGYCLPKDAKQLLSNYESIPQKLISAIVASNDTRKSFLVQQIASRKPSTVGIYRLTMKTGSDNFRDSSTFGIMRSLREKGIDFVIYEPLLAPDHNFKEKVINDLELFKNSVDVIVANRFSDALLDVREKVFTRDIFFRD